MREPSEEDTIEYKILFSFLLTVAEIFAIDKLENWIEKLYLSIFELDNNQQSLNQILKYLAYVKN